MKKAIASIYILFICIYALFTACKKNRQGDIHYACPAIAIASSFQFNVLAKNSDTDLFFGNAPKLQTSDLYFFRGADPSRTDTIRPLVIGSGSNRHFKLYYGVSTTDTLIMTIPGYSDSKIRSTFKQSDDRCPQQIVDQLYLDGAAVIPTDGNYVFFKKPVIIF